MTPTDGLFIECVVRVSGVCYCLYDAVFCYGYVFGDSIVIFYGVVNCFSC